MCTSIVVNKNKTIVGWNLDLLDMEYRVRSAAEEKKEDYSAEGMSIGMCFGVAVATALHINVGIGMMLGMLLGLSIGSAIEKEEDK